MPKTACGCGGGWCDASRRAARRLHRAGSGWPGHFPAEARAALSELAWPKVRAPLNAHRHRGPGARVTDLAPARASSCWAHAGSHWTGATTTCSVLSLGVLKHRLRARRCRGHPHAARQLRPCLDFGTCVFHDCVIIRKALRRCPTGARRSLTTCGSHQQSQHVDQTECTQRTTAPTIPQLWALTQGHNVRSLDRGNGPSGCHGYHIVRSVPFVQRRASASSMH